MNTIYSYCVNSDSKILYGFLQLDFMGEKITNRLIAAQDVSRLYEQFNYHSEREDKDTYLGSLDRFDAMAFEWLNFTHDPILGYGRNSEHSYFYTNITTNYGLANGLMLILSSYGFFLGVFFFYVRIFGYLLLLHTLRICWKLIR